DLSQSVDHADARVFLVPVAASARAGAGPHPLWRRHVARLCRRCRRTGPFRGAEDLARQGQRRGPRLHRKGLSRPLFRSGGARPPVAPGAAELRFRALCQRPRERQLTPCPVQFVPHGRTGHAAATGERRQAMPVESIEVLVVGGGQAGLAASEHLGRSGVPHLILERHRIAERWRSQRWDSLVANGPAWHDRFPGMTYPDCDPDAFPGKESVADYFEAYARKISAPIRCGVEVTSVVRNDGRPGFRATTSAGAIDATYVIAATGPFQRPVVPSLVPESAGLVQMHSAAYRNPSQLPGGAVLVVGAGSSGSQIADELLRAGRRVFLSVGPHDRPPRTYRGRDFVWWLGVLGKWDAATPPAGAEHVTIAVSGAYGGQTVDFRRFAERGMTLVGRT